MMSNETTLRSLPVKLTREEIAAYSLELARLTREESEIEDEKKSVTSSFKDRLDRCKFERAVLARKVNSGEEVRQVPCTVIKDYEMGVARLTRDDTGATTETWKLSASDMQEWLQFEQEDVSEPASNEVEKQEEPAVEPPADGVTICGNTGCRNYDHTEPNGCITYENAWECREAIGEVVRLAEEADHGPTLSELCEACHKATACNECCSKCTDPCKSQQHCRWPEPEAGSSASC